MVFNLSLLFLETVRAGKAKKKKEKNARHEVCVLLVSISRLQCKEKELLLLCRGCLPFFFPVSLENLVWKSREKKSVVQRVLQAVASLLLVTRFLKLKGAEKKHLRRKKKKTIMN